MDTANIEYDEYGWQVYPDPLDPVKTDVFGWVGAWEPAAIVEVKAPVGPLSGSERLWKFNHLHDDGTCSVGGDRRTGFIVVESGKIKRSRIL